MIKNLNFSVLTKTGFQKFDGIKESIRINNIKFTFKDFSTIIVTPEHRFFVGKNKSGQIYRKAKNINIGNKILNKIVIKKENDVVCSNKFYDLINVANGNNYITSGFTSHNCAFIRPSVFEEFIDAFLPSQAALAWKKNIILSTPKGMNHFYEIVKGASPKHEEPGSGIKEKGTTGYSLFKVDWRDVPRYDKNGNIIKPEDFMNSIIKKHGVLYWKQNFECSFLGSSHTLISSEKLKEFTAKEPLEIRDGKLKIYAYPEKGHQYICSVDPAKDGQDAFAVQIIDITGFKFKQVASAQLQIDYLLMPEYINDWCQYYNLPYLIIENNEGAGQSIADQMKNDYDYDNLHYDKNDNSNSTNLTKGRKKYPGFRTTTRTRKLILQTMKLFIENNNLEINDKETIKEFFTFILMNNKYQADENCHDDMIMSLALIFAPFCNAKNFDDMKDLIKNLYSEEVEGTETDKSSFTEYLNIGSFDDGTNIDEEYMPKSTWNGYNMEPDGFF